MKEIKHSRAHKTWNEDEILYLREKWGNTSVDSISRYLGRSKVAVMEKSQRLGLGAFFDNAYRYVTRHALVVALGRGSYSYKEISWIKNRGLKTHKIKRYNKVFEVIYLEEFWKWAYENQSFLDFSRFEKYALGPEPEWVERKRKADFVHSAKFLKTPWTQAEDLRLRCLLKEHKYGFKELSILLNRTEGAIQRRINDLKIKERPVKADNHIKWTKEEYLRLGEMIKAGYKYEQMSDVLEKSAKAIRGRVFDMYFTEKLDVVRKYIGNGDWGDGRPDIQLRYLKKLPSDEREDIKCIISELAFIIREYAKAQSGASKQYREYWQKDICKNWDDVFGCTAQESDCDSCSSFSRIKVQYCKRCGKDFYERKQNDICKSCREARLRQARRKWAILHNKES